MDSESDNDEELTPMVDGLSSALAIMILVTTVFMMSSINTTVEVYSKKIMFVQSKVDFENNIVFYNEGLNISDEEYDTISKRLNSQTGNRVMLTGYQKGNYDEKLTYNLIKFKEKLNLKDKIFDYEKKEKNFCGRESSCIKWEVR
ncbi:hypothetical protein DP590_07500 [Salmonella enterica]|nr:hypothetical protein [Salmonella enterica]ECE0741998.1 hypothetical protein [Salmonella enterica subsp. enterica serovar Hvittingfoss]EGA8118249.1 hypothetical protein [Salmonella enterica]EHO8673528.1 hypothetical protein [Salmonella enterica]MJE82239.1 hypothetical protein [Salmonella enterica]